MIKAVLFDFDGTLADSSEGIFYTAISVMHSLGFSGPWSDDELRRFVGPPLRDCFKVAFNLEEGLCDEAVKRYSAIYKEKGMYMCKLYPGILAAIAELKKQNIKIGLATNKTQSVAASCLEILGVDRLFDVFYGSDVKTGRFKRETIALSAEKLGLKPSECLMVGDSENDREGALGAGARFLAVSWGFGYSSTSDFTGIDYINTPNELVSYVNKINNKEIIK